VAPKHAGRDELLEAMIVVIDAKIKANWARRVFIGAETELLKAQKLELEWERGA
jgi:hypothetical protein